MTATASLPGYPQPGVSVRRRFSDFVTLARLLKAQYRGYFVPPRPDKNAVENASQRFKVVIILYGTVLV